MNTEPRGHTSDEVSQLGDGLPIFDIDPGGKAVCDPDVLTGRIRQ
jgi:hypothetical protein